MSDHRPMSVVWLQAHGQRLGLLPHLGGGVAAWQWLEGAAGGPVDLWRPWDGASDDRYTFASFAMLPWSNRISGGGFEHDGRLHAVRRNRIGEPYPIHGDGWLQPWRLAEVDASRAVLRLNAYRFQGNPYVYDAEQTFCLVEGGLDQRLRVTHRGDAPLPYGLGLHPWFPRTPHTRLTANVSGVWLGRDDRLPTQHTTQVPPDWDLRPGASMHGTLVDNAYTGWDGLARIEWPEHALALQMQTLPLDTPSGPLAPAYCLLYRPETGDAFCFEPVTHPIDAFHLDGRPGLLTLAPGQTLELSVHWRVLPG
jgi:aldose 1-epimerase